MHSDIFVLDSEVTDDEIFEGLQTYISDADYVRKMDDKSAKEDYKWFTSVTDLPIDGDTLVLTKDTVINYWLEKFDKFVNEISKSSFCVETRRKLIKLLNDERGFYIFYGGCMYTLDDFMEYRYSEPGDSFTIYSVYDYHC